ncbi:MAG: GatB/YqeY domain-containing protein [Bauldia sp.]|nr:GatB/YqeY domain-containing protein [Bauldia sp.]
MAADAAKAMKDRLRADLRIAMKAGATRDAGVIRALVAALDNAQAPPVRKTEDGGLGVAFASGAAEVERLLLDEDDVRRVLLADIAERQSAAADLLRLGRTDRAEALHAEIAVARHYLD